MLCHPIGAVERRNLRLNVGVPSERSGRATKPPVDCCCSSPAGGADRRESDRVVVVPPIKNDPIDENMDELLLLPLNGASERNRERLPGCGRFRPDSTRLVGGESG